MSGPTLVRIAAGILASVVVCAGLVDVAAGGQGGDDCTPAANSSGAPDLVGPTALSGGYPRIGPWDATQVGNAATIIAVGAQRGVPARGWVIAVATAMQESSLRNLPGGDRDSIGLFQQRPSQGWGTPAQLLDPVYAASRFYAKLVTVPGWAMMPLTEAAQAVQNSGTPNAYADEEPGATQIVEQLTGLAGLGCGAAVGPRGWVAPVRARIVSGFRPPGRPNHQGVDLGADRGTPIHAAASGTVTVATCNADPASYGCDRDGNEGIRGCGWYVDIAHGAGVSTRYCHMLRRPTVAAGQRVAAGQVLGVVGSSGNSSGEHLHYEVHLNARATDPVAWMRAHQAPLGLARL